MAEEMDRVVFSGDALFFCEKYTGKKWENVFIKLDLNSLIHIFRYEPDAETLFESVELDFIWDYMAVGPFINETISPKLAKIHEFLPQPMEYTYNSLMAFPIRRKFCEDPKDLELENIAFLSFNWDDLNVFMKAVQKTLTQILIMEKIGVIPEIENSYKYEEQIMMGPRDALNQYLSDKSLLSSCCSYWEWKSENDRRPHFGFGLHWYIDHKNHGHDVDSVDPRMPSFLYKEKETWTSVRFLPRRTNNDDEDDDKKIEEKRPTTAQKKEAAEVGQKPIPPRPPTAKEAKKPEIPPGYRQVYLDGISKPPTWIPQTCFYPARDGQGRSVVKINLSDPSKFIKSE